jgi:hypothetical protein
MRIEKMNPDADLYQGYSDDLVRVVEAQKCADRPCTNCDVPCAAHKSPTCACGCTLSCAQAPQKMSSDGEKFPIEDGIAPLVLAFLQLREFTPCWSCGGHEAEAGRDARPPRVIFYARSTLYPALISEAVSTLSFQRKLTCPWEVVVTPVGNMLDATYTLQPNLAAGEDPTLAQLKIDARTIAESLEKEVVDAAFRYQAELQTALKTPVPKLT